MPNKSLSPCTYPGCSSLVRGGRCEKHPYDSTPYRDAQRDGLYSTAGWRKMRRMQLARAPWCVDCLGEKVYTPASDVDHIKPHRGNRALFFDYGNLQSLCHSCHSRKTAGEVWGRGSAKTFPAGG
jgi:5-methylcytosine-specific restriction enzyme A